MNSKNVFRVMTTVVVMLVAISVGANAQGVNARIVEVPGYPMIGDTWDKLTNTQRSNVVFDRFPKSVDEFEAVRLQIGKNPAGAVALVIMSFEMYRRDNSVGLECGKRVIQKIDINSIFSGVTPKLRDVYKTRSENNNFESSFHTATFLKGAKSTDGFNPTEPYTIEVKVDPNAKLENYSETFNGYYISVMVRSQAAYEKNKVGNSDETKAENGSWMPLRMIKTKKTDRSDYSQGTYYIFDSCSNLYTSAPYMSLRDGDFKGLK